MAPATAPLQQGQTRATRLPRRIEATLDQHAGVVAIGETFDGEAELAASYCDQLHMAFNFDLVQQPFRANRLQDAIARWDTLLAHEHTWPSYVLSDHDNSRHASRLSSGMPTQERDARAKVAAAMLLTLRGTPFVYYGEEIGNDATIPADEQHDIGFGRDGCRSPMQWSADSYAGFSTVRPCLPMADDCESRNVARQTGDPRAVLSFYRQLIWLRNESPALRLGEWTPLLRDPDTCTVYLRSHESQAMLVALNLTKATQRLRLDSELPTRRSVPRLSTRRPDVGWSVILGRELTLGPYEATIFEAAGPAT